RSSDLIVLNFCLGSVVNNEIRLKVLQLFCCRLNEHICYEVSLPSNFHDETDRHTCIFVCAAECVNYEKSLVGELVLSDLFHCIPCFLACRVVIILVLII